MSGYKMPKLALNRINHYIPPATRFEEYKPEKIEPCADDSFIFWLFRYRCASCRQSGQEINEIVPRSRQKDAASIWKNRIVLCRVCHERYHHDGLTKEKMQAMKDLRVSYLQSVGRGEYV